MRKFYYLLLQQFYPESATSSLWYPVDGAASTRDSSSFVAEGKRDMSNHAKLLKLLLEVTNTTSAHISLSEAS